MTRTQNDGPTGDSTPRPRAPGEIVSAAATVDARRAVKVEESAIINRPRADVYAFYRTLSNLAGVVPYLESVTERDATHSHWVVKAPGGYRLEWDAELVNDFPNDRISWKTVGHPDVAHAGSVHFTSIPGGRGTGVRLVMDYEPPGGRPGHMLSKLFGVSPEQMIRDDLQRLKELLAGSPR